MSSLSFKPTTDSAFENWCAARSLVSLNRGQQIQIPSPKYNFKTNRNVQLSSKVTLLNERSSQILCLKDDISASSSSTAFQLSNSQSSNGTKEDTSIGNDAIDSSPSTSPSPTSTTHDFWETVLNLPNPPTDDYLTTFAEQQKPEKPFPCSSCDARFKKRCNLISHVKNVHEKLRPFGCSVCFRRFARKSNCVKHVSQSISISLSFTLLNPIKKRVLTNDLSFSLFLSKSDASCSSSSKR